MHLWSASSSDSLQRRGGGRGFSVIELLLVLSILVLIAALTLPAVERWQGERPIREASDQLLDQLRLARLQAIDQGQPVAFRYRLGSSEFSIESGQPPLLIEDQLPETVQFGPVKSQSADWSDPLWFHANGTSQDAALELVDDEGRTQHLVVRRLTGGVAIE